MHTPSCTHPHAHTLMHTPSCTHPHAHTLMHTPSCTHPHAHTIKHTPSCTHPHAHTIMHTPSCTHPHAHTLMHTPSCTHHHAHTLMHNTMLTVLFTSHTFLTPVVRTSTFQCPSSPSGPTPWVRVTVMWSDTEVTLVTVTVATALVRQQQLHP